MTLRTVLSLDVGREDLFVNVWTLLYDIAHCVESGCR